MKKIYLLSLILFLVISTNVASQNDPNKDRVYWSNLAYKMSKPILLPMSQGKLKKSMPLELSPTWDGRNTDVAYTEAFGRLMAGIAPWLALPNDDTEESKQREELRDLAIKSYKNAVDPKSPDYLNWKAHHQTLVDASYIANSFMRAPKALWEPLNDQTKKRYIEEFKALRKVAPPYNNWLLFRTMIEAFLLSIDEEYDGYVLSVALRKINEWYLSDGWYSDGPEFALDYYNAYVMHPMIVEITEVAKEKKVYTPISFDLALRRMQRYNELIERLISPEGTFPAMGRSMTYRMGAFQALALASWKYGLPESLSNGQVRNALTSVMKRMFANPENFTSDDYLQLGFVGHQPELADYYTNNGSLYITSLVFLPLGLKPTDPFWTAKPEKWTSQKAWDGEAFKKDYHVSIQK